MLSARKIARCHCLNDSATMATMSGSELVTVVNEVIHDKSIIELTEENKALCEELKRERLSRRQIEIVSFDRTVFAVGSLEGIKPGMSDYSLVPGSFRVPVKMVKGVRTCKRRDLDFLKIRIGGIVA